MSEDQKVPTAHDLAAVKSDAEKFEVSEINLRVLRPEPGVQKSVGDKLFVPLDKITAMGAPHGGDFVRTLTDYYFYGLELYDPSKQGDEAYSYVSGGTGDEFGQYDVDGKLRDHSVEPFDKIRWTYAPPVLWDEGGKLQKGWFFSFLNDVVPLRRQIRVRMPSFRFAAGEAEAVADYFAHKSAKEWPALFARSARLAQKKDAATFAKDAGLDPNTLLEIENGVAVATKANFGKVRAYADKSSFLMRPAVQPAFEAIRTRSQGYLDARAAALSGHMKIGEAVAVKGVNCFQCHFRLGQPPPADPIAWAPDMSRVRERLREDWVHDWLVNPATTYPGTSMPANFASTPPQYQEHYQGSTNEDQVQAVMDWVYNFDRMYMGANN
jgi:hypothetical protein